MTKKKGFTLITVVIIVMILTAIGGGVVTITRSIQSSATNNDKNNQVTTISEHGIERAIQTLLDDSDWSNNSGTLFQDESFAGGTYTVTLSSATTDRIVLSITSYYQGFKKTIEKTVGRPLNESGQIQDSVYVAVSTANAYVGGCGNRYLYDIKLANSHPTRNINITEVIISWLTNSSEAITAIRIGSTNVWSGDEDSNALINISDYTLNALQSNIDVQLTYDSNVATKVFSINFRFSDGSSKSIDFDPQDSGQGTQASKLLITTANAEITGRNDNNLTDITLKNESEICGDNIVITGLKVAWFYDNPTRKIQKVKIHNTTCWTGNTSSGSNIAFTSNYTLNSNQTKELQLYFNGDMDYRLVTFNVILADDSEKYGEADFSINQANYLHFDNEDLSIYPSYTIKEIELENTHDDADIWIDKMYISIEPSTNQKIETIEIDDDTIFSGSQNLDTTFNITTTMIGNDDSEDHQIDFSSSIENATINMTYIMVDGTSTTNSFSPEIDGGGGINDSSLFSHTTRNISVETHNTMKWLRGLKLNSAETDYKITKIKLSWSPSSQKLTKIKMGSLTVKNNPSGYSSGTLIDINDYLVPAGAASIESYFMWWDYIINKDFNIEYYFEDGSTTNIEFKFNPNSHIAADNFETENFNGGHGFSSNWQKEYGDSWVQWGSNSFSGGCALLIKKSTSIKRRLNLSAYSAMKISFYAKLKSFESNDKAYFEISDNGGASWTTVKTWQAGDITTHTYNEYDLSSYNLNSNFYIRFRTNANQNNDQLYIDEIYFFQ
jgi:hypothetical protein